MSNGFSQVEAKEIQILHELSAGTPWQLICKKFHVSSKTIAKIRDIARTGMLIDESSMREINRSLSELGFEASNSRELEAVVRVLVENSRNQPSKTVSDVVDPLVREFYDASVNRGYSGTLRDFIRDLAQQFMEDRNLKIISAQN